VHKIWLFEFTSKHRFLHCYARGFAGKHVEGSDRCTVSKIPIKIIETIISFKLRRNNSKCETWSRIMNRLAAYSDCAHNSTSRV
jgi:hypothetical protein